ncbi:class I mannose-6-phosphate isomerase [Bosea sp. SSUT16]|jgi:mannose-6-phosphate isomerase|uniref:Class I mannose-6-phosphate isomerase n=1 Tax=Bosea spartocytisi TaxID=2773451 RepID=A0A927EBH2_9HYPH|nr:class I mannose-6-phosphate isomerase [Bosea spartocytisi]MBD3847838.1 class I mannose-6-phosphate isomerase [Bosea spartocytisi]MCT4471464.1 class I mannose-6-phosphate isomerase [Bosea spartocytisi]
MALEQACMELIPKPWGSTDLLPWSGTGHLSVPIGELWFQRCDKHAPEPALLLKLLFTREALSIQVHPDDAAAHGMELPRGKTEAWYILSATSDAAVGVGLKAVVTPEQLRAAVADGSIARFVAWHKPHAGEVIAVPAGTIHAIGAGLVLAEIQQRSDTTFRLFDHGRARDLHIEQGVAVAHVGPTKRTAPARRLSGVRTLLVANPYFVFERIDLPAGSIWELDARCETWLAAIAGDARIGTLQIGVGQGCFIEAQAARIAPGEAGLSCLVAYDAATPSRHLLQRVDGEGMPKFRETVSPTTGPPQAVASSPVPSTEARS